MTNEMDSIAQAANTELAQTEERIAHLRGERAKINQAIKDSVTRKAYLQRVVRAMNPTPRKRSQDGQPQ